MIILNSVLPKKLSLRKELTHVKGVPIEDCIKFVWSIVNEISIKNKAWFGIYSREDMFQDGFLELLKRSKFYNPDYGVKLFTYLYPTIKYNAVIRGIQKNWGVKIPARIWNTYNCLCHQYKNHRDYSNYDTGVINFELLYQDKLINNNDKILYEAFSKFKICSFDTNIVNVVSYKNNKELEFENLKESFISYLQKLKNITARDKIIFLYSSGIIGSLTNTEIAKKFFMSLDNVYKCKNRVKNKLLTHGKWVSEIYGEQILQKLRIKE